MLFPEPTQSHMAALAMQAIYITSNEFTVLHWFKKYFIAG